MTAMLNWNQARLLVDNARLVMRQPTADLAGTWPRISAILGRQALELALDQFWSEVAPGVENATRRAQLLCLPEYIDADVANRARYAWYGLSAACHHHAYELPPVAAELNGWLAEVETLIERLGANLNERDHER